MTAKLRQGSHGVADEWDTQAVAEQDAYSSTRAHILEECQLVHPITYDKYNSTQDGAATSGHSFAPGFGLNFPWARTRVGARGQAK